MFTIATTLATCPVCTANSVPHGWLILSATVLSLAVGGAFMTAWLDGRRNGAAQFQRIDRD
jgi:hypothetical protein